MALLKGLVLLWLIPAFQTPDEYGHYDYVLYLAQATPAGFVRADGLRGAVVDPRAYATREIRCLAEATGTARHMDEAIPVRVAGSFAEQMAHAERCRALDSAATLPADGRVNALFNYPPFYHFAAATFNRLLRAAGVNPLVIFYATRGCSSLLLVVALVVSARLMQALDVSEGVATTALYFLALHPELSMLSVAVHPDLLGLVLVTAAMLALVRLAMAPSMARGLWLGLVVGALLLTKLHLALPLILAGLAVLVAAVLADPRGTRAWLWPGAVALASAIATGGWWYARSLILFGNAVGLMETGASPIVVPASPLENLSFFVNDRLEPLFRSYWGVWGWLDYGLGPGAVPWLAVVTWVPAVLGALAVIAWRRQSPPPHGFVSRRAVAAGTIVAAAMVLFAVEMLYITARLGAVNDQGRHWLAYAVVHAMYFGSVIAACSDASLGRIARLAASARGVCATTAAAGAGLALAGVVLWLVVNRPTGYVEVDLQTSVDSRLDVFVNAGIRADPLERETVEVRKRDGMATRRLPIRSAVVRGLRLDPIAAPGTAILGSVRVTDTFGSVLASVPLEAFVAVHDVAAARMQDARLRVETTPGGSDPILEAALPAELPLGIDPVQRFFKRARPGVIEIYRAWPATTWLVPAAPSCAALAVMALGLLRLGRPRARRVEDAARQWRATWKWGLVAVLGAINVWLAFQTWVYYRG